VYKLQINGTTLAAGDTVNFNATTPAAPSNGYAITLATSKSGTTDSISAALVGNGTATQYLSGTGVFSTPASSIVVSGSSTMGTSAISSGTCATVVTTTATGTTTTGTGSHITATPSVDPTGVTGYGPSSSGSLYIQAYPTSNNVNFKVCNNTSASITPSALTLNWIVQ